VLPRLDSDLLPLLAGDLSQEPQVGERAAVTVVLSGGDYPERGDQGTPIEGIEAAEATGALVFHAGTALHDGRLVTNGGRILNVVGTGATVAEARSAAYEATAHIDFAGVHCRSDIADGDGRVGILVGRSPTASGCRAPRHCSTRPASATSSRFGRPTARPMPSPSTHGAPRGRGLRVLDLRRGLSAALPGAVAAQTDLR
jgi:hypothetical protein